GPGPLLGSGPGVVLALAMLGNTRLFALPVLVVAFLAWRIGSARRAAEIAAAVFVCAGVAVLPWLVRNDVQLGCFALTTDGRALWKANNPFTHSVLARGGWIDDVPRHQPPGRPPTAAEAQTSWQRGE